MINNILKILLNYLQFVKNFFHKFFHFLFIIKNVILDEIFFDSKTKEPFRELIKGYIFYFKNKFNIGFFYDYLKFGFYKIFKKIPFLGFICERILRYFLVFLFIIWILFESFFFRFYLVDTPLDTKMFQDRKEFKTSRFIPVVGFETLSFYSRPFWRIFNNFIVFFSNLFAIFWLIYFVYILDFLLLINFIFSKVLSIFFLILSFLHYFFFRLNFYMNQFIFVFLLFCWRLYFYFCKIFSCLNYIFILPFLFFFNLLDFLFFGFFRFYFFFTVVDFKDLKKKFGGYKKYYKKGDLFYNIFLFCSFLESVLKIYFLKLNVIDDNSGGYFFFKINKLENNRIIFFFFRFLKFVYYFLSYIFFFYLILFFFFNFIYLPFFF